MSVTATTSVSQFLALYVESQGRTSPAFSASEEAALQETLAQFQLTTATLAQIATLLDALEVMRAMVTHGELPASSLDAIELSIQMLLQDNVSRTAGAPAPANAPPPPEPLPGEVQAFSNTYLTSTYLQSAPVWPGADTRIQSDLRQFDQEDTVLATVTQYMYGIADQRRYLAAIDAALHEPDGFLYAAPADPDYQTYLAYQEARAATAAGIDGYVTTVQDLLAGRLNAWAPGFDTVPWSATLTDPLAAVPPSGVVAQAQFEIAEDKLLLSQLGSQARTIEDQVAQLNAQLSPRVTPPLAQEQVLQLSTQLAGLKQQARQVASTMAAVQARLAYNNTVAAGGATDANKALTLDLDVDVARGLLAAAAPPPVDPGSSQPVPTSALQQQLSADKAAYAALISAPPPPPPPTPVAGQPLAPSPPPKPTLQLIEGYIGQLTYQLNVPTGIELTPEQVDELGLLWAHRNALNTQYQAVNAELAALKARMDYAQAVLGGWQPYAQDEWNRLNADVAQATLRRVAGERNPPTSGALTTPPAETVAWKLSGADPAHVEISRIDNFLLTAQENDLVYERLSEFAGYVGAVTGDTLASASARTTLLATISKISTSTSGGQAQKANAQTQLARMDSVIAWLDTFSPDAATAYANAESARTVTDYRQVNAWLSGVAASTDEMLYDDQVLASLKLDLANSNAFYYANTTDAGSRTARTRYAQAIYLLASNVYDQKLYAYKAAMAPDEATRQSYLGSLAIAESAYPSLLDTTLARYFDYAYAATTNASTWPRTLSSSMGDAQKAAEVMSHYNGEVYALVDPIATTNLA